MKQSVIVFIGVFCLFAGFAQGRQTADDSSAQSLPEVLADIEKEDGRLRVSDLHCEMLQNPEGIGTAAPRFSWIINTGIGARNVEQVSYQILVSSSLEKLKNNEADLWDSGEVESDQSILVDYEGKPLQSRSLAFWKVKIKTNRGEEQWSDTARFSVGLLDASDWQAKWIGLDKIFSWDSETEYSRLSARYFRKEFDNKKAVRSAKVYISGLGLYELYINGQKVGDQVLAPTPTDYTKTVKYNTFDITSYLQSGKNAIGTILGNGHFYNMRQNFKTHKIKTFGYPKMLFQLEIEYADHTKQTIISDHTWKVTADGPIRSNNDFDGEEYDATKELGKWNEIGYQDSKWLKAELVQAPAGKLSAQMNDNMKVMATVKPVNIIALTPDTFIVDMGQNMVGWVQLTVKGKKGNQIVLRFAETLEQDGRLKTVNLRSARQTDIFLTPITRQRHQVQIAIR